MNTIKTKMNNNYFKMPTLQNNGKLLQEDALSIYKHYLTQDKFDYNKQSRRPCRSAIFKAMVKTHSEQTIDAGNFVNTHLEKGGKVLFWSDQHFYHENIIDYADRPFENIEQMNNLMLSNYFKNVTDEDLVIFGGDVSFGDVERTKNLLQALPGKKILVLGNHDFDKNKMIFRDYGIFNVITMGFVFYWTFNDKIANIIVTHYPIDNKWLPLNTINVHGHIHQYQADRKNINMAVEHLEYAPQKLGERIKQAFLENY